MRFPAVRDLRLAHARLLARTGGTRGEINPGAVHSALERARWGPFHGDGALAERAALLLRGMVADHPFADGNKRAALEALDLFLGLNGAWIEETGKNVIEFVVRMAEGEIELEDATEWLQRRLQYLEEDEPRQVIR